MQYLFQVLIFIFCRFILWEIIKMELNVIVTLVVWPVTAEICPKIIRKTKFMVRHRTMQTIIIGCNCVEVDMTIRQSQRVRKVTALIVNGYYPTIFSWTAATSPSITITPITIIQVVASDCDDWVGRVGDIGVISEEVTGTTLKYDSLGLNYFQGSLVKS